MSVEYYWLYSRATHLIPTEMAILVDEKEEVGEQER